VVYERFEEQGKVVRGVGDHGLLVGGLPPNQKKCSIYIF
jgi:hypothetical protein